MKTKIITSLITAVIIVTSYLGYVFYQEISFVNQMGVTVSQDHATLVQIVGLINKAK